MLVVVGGVHLNQQLSFAHAVAHINQDSVDTHTLNCGGDIVLFVGFDVGCEHLGLSHGLSSCGLGFDEHFGVLGLGVSVGLLRASASDEHCTECQRQEHSFVDFHSYVVLFIFFLLQILLCC